MNIPDTFRGVRGRLIVSCQAWPDDPFHGSENMVLFARTAVAGGAAGIRANGPEDVRAIRAAGITVPIVAIQKRDMPDGRILITPTVDDARALAEAGATAIAVDCTIRGQSYGALDRLRTIRESLRIPVAADIATVDEAVAAAGAGADFVLSTMRGYTNETAHVRAFEPRFIAELVRAVAVPVIAEGRVADPEDARAALRAGAFSVIVGSAITRPRDITARFVAALRCWALPERSGIIAIDVGGSNVKYGVVDARTGGLETAESVRTARESRNAILAQLREIARTQTDAARSKGLTIAAAGVSTAGWVDSDTGTIVYGTGNLPEWTGTPVGPAVAEAAGVPAFVENDAHAFAVAERRFGLGRTVSNFLCVTLGTGIGGGAYVDGRLVRGARSLAGAFGHMALSNTGPPCTCGRRGCLEAFAGASALLRYVRPARYRSARALIATANGGDTRAREAIRTCARYLARGCATAAHLLDPEMVILGGGLVQNNPILVEELSRELSESVIAWNERRIEVRVSELGYHAGVLGAAAVALERM